MKGFWTKRESRVFLTVLIAGFITHGFRLANKFLCLDSYNYLETISLSWTVSLGRYLLHYVEDFRGPRELTWLIGCLSIFYIALAAVLITKLFDLKSRVSQLLCGVLLVCNPVVTGTFAYMYTADGYFLGLFFSVLAAYCVIRIRGVKGQILGGLSMIVFLALYQAYISVTILLLMIWLLLMLLKGETKLSDLCKEAGRYMVMGIAAAAVYLAGVPIFRSYYAVGDDAVKLIGGTSTEGAVNHSLLEGLKESWVEFARYFLVRWQLNFYNISNVLLFVLLGVLILIACKKGGLFKKPVRLLLIPVWILLLPPVTHVFSFVSARNIYQSSPASFSLSLFYILPLILMEQPGLKAEITEWKAVKKHPLAFANLLLLVLISLHFVVIANRAYESMAMANERTENFLNRLQTRIEMTEGYEEGMPLAVIGNVYQLPEYVPSAPMMSGVVSNIFLQSQADYVHALNWHLSTSYTEYPTERHKKLVRREEFADMEPWPSEMSVRRIGKTMVVYLSDNNMEELLQE
ncbi:MAG: glucosyltransferase domain-containing protein [Lachnospiraceae bacterium]|nr:glucosyltransferase domain-containing protein [Lachnospiraceae bacterium]